MYAAIGDFGVTVEPINLIQMVLNIHVLSDVMNLDVGSV